MKRNFFNLLPNLEMGSERAAPNGGRWASESLGRERDGVWESFLVRRKQLSCSWSLPITDLWHPHPPKF